MYRVMRFKKVLFIALAYLNIAFFTLSSPLMAANEEEIAVSSGSFKNFQEIEHAVKERYPRYFRGSDKLDEATIENYRKTWVSFTGTNMEVFLVLHNPALLPALEKLEKAFIDYDRLHSGHAEVVSRFLREIQFHKENEAVSPCWLEILPFRLLCATSTINSQERDFISHLTEPYPTLFLSLQENQAWRNHESTVEIMKRHNNKISGLNAYQYCYLSYEAVQEIKEIIEKSTPKQITYPIWERGQIGISFIVKEMLNDIFLFGVPLKNLKAHGILSSPYGFAVHDLFHMSVDHRLFSLIQHIIDQGDKYVSNGGSVQKFLSVFIPAALTKYKGIMDGLKEIYQRITGTFEQLESRKAMLGFFWILHEEPIFPSYLYTVRNFDDILKIITEDDGKSDVFTDFPSSTKEQDDVSISLIEPEAERNLASGIDLNDHFKTSPFDGTSEWTDDEIIGWVLKNKKIREARKYELIDYFGQDDEPINTEDIVAQSIRRSPYYIDVSFTLRQGGELVYSFQTLFYNMQATHDALRILEFIDIKTDLPSLSLTQNPRVAAQAFIHKGEKDIDNLIKCFRKVASAFANENFQGGESLIERYSRLYDMSNLSLYEN